VLSGGGEGWTKLWSTDLSVLMVELGFTPSDLVFKKIEKTKTT
jgi:hypothetical protein